MQVMRWRRFGKDRLYVRDAQGNDLGWWDLEADLAHPASGETERSLCEAVAAWQQGPSIAPAPEPVPESAPTREAPQGPDFVAPDLGGSALDLLPVDVVDRPEVRNDEALRFPPPSGPPVSDLAYNRPGQQLAAKVSAARQAGGRPTLWRRLWLGKNAYSTWERGMIGERLVAEALSRLVKADARWSFINSIPVGEEVDIDAFVVGPAGVFTINAKYHRGARIWVGGDTFMVNGTRQPYVRNSRHEARKASRLLTQAIGQPVGVRGIVVPVDARAFIVKEQPADVHVVNRSRLPRYLRSRPQILDPDMVARVFEVARLSSTWLPRS